MGFLRFFRIYRKIVALSMKVNVLEYRVTTLKGKELNFSWVTNITLSKANVLKISKGGRARWKVENETFNTLKNLGYNLEHNYGHGKKYLSTILCMLMMIAFLIDQIQEICCAIYRRCRTAERNTVIFGRQCARFLSM